MVKQMDSRLLQYVEVLNSCHTVLEVNIAWTKAFFKNRDESHEFGSMEIWELVWPLFENRKTELPPALPMVMSDAYKSYGWD